MKFSGDIVEQVKNNIDIVDVISEYFPLKRSGRNYKALCPFHDEKTPSFMVNPERQIFRCFGCGAGGDVLNFVMRQEGYSFPEALRHLAEKVGLSLPTADPAAASRRDRLLALHELAADFFHWGLTASKNGEVARRYLKDRGIGSEAIKQFRLGYAQPSWDSFCRHALKKGYRKSELVSGGLALEREGGGQYDRFRKRLVIPVRDPRGKTVGFGARVLDDSTPKYINSPETELFHKGKLLFGLDSARKFIARSEEAILGEGYLDVIRAAQEGVGNMVCSQGTAFTPEQSRLLKRHARRVVIAYDADAAGLEAALKGLDVFLADSLEVAIVLLPPGEDPDSFIQAHGPQAFTDLAKESRPLLDYKLDVLCARYQKEGDQGTLRIARGMLDSISRIESPILKETALEKVATRLGVSPGAIRDEAMLLAARSRPVRPQVVSAPVPLGEKNERNLLKLLFYNDKIINLIEKELVPEDFSPELRALVKTMLELAREGNYPLSRVLPSKEHEPRAQELIAQWLFEEKIPPADLEEILDYVIYVKKRGVRLRAQEIDRAIAEEENKGKDTSDLQKHRVSLEIEARTLGRRLKEKYSK